MRPSTFPELIQLKATKGTQEAVREAAAREGQTASEFIRQAIRGELRRAGADQVADAHAGGD